MADKVEKKENLMDTPVDDEVLPEVAVEEGMMPGGRIAELENLLASKDEGLARANSRLAELEDVLASREQEIDRLKQAQANLETELADSAASLKEAVAGYRAMVIEANPEVITELISGDSVEAINESLEQAKALVSKVRQVVEAEISSARVPAGAPGRTSPDFSALSPREKIQHAMVRSSS